MGSAGGEQKDEEERKGRKERKKDGAVQIFCLTSRAPYKETAGEGTGRAALGISGRTGGRFCVQPERYGTKIANWGKVTLLRL